MQIELQKENKLHFEFQPVMFVMSLCLIAVGHWQ